MVPDTDGETLGAAFKALGHPARVQILARLAACCPPGTTCDVTAGPLETLPCVSDLGADLGIAPSTLSHHVKELSRAGLIETRRHGQTIRCGLGANALTMLTGFLDRLTAATRPSKQTETNHEQPDCTC